MGGGGVVSAFESFVIGVKSAATSHYSWQLAWKKDRASLANFMNYSIDSNLKALAQDPHPTQRQCKLTMCRPLWIRLRLTTAEDTFQVARDSHSNHYFTFKQHTIPDVKLMSLLTSRKWTVRFEAVPRLRSYEMWRHVVWNISTHVSEEPTAYFFLCFAGRASQYNLSN